MTEKTTDRPKKNAEVRDDQLAGVSGGRSAEEITMGYTEVEWTYR